MPFLMLSSSPLRFITCDLKIDENLFSGTFHTSIAVVQPKVKVKMESESRTHKSGLSFLFRSQFTSFGFVIVVINPERSFKYFSGIN